MGIIVSVFIFALTLPSFAQINTGNGTLPCNENTDYGTGLEIHCSQLHINGPLTNSLGSSPIIIRVKGSVIIENGGHFVLNGQDGIPYNTGNPDTDGGDGGPGGGPGGGLQFFATSDAPEDGSAGTNAIGRTPLFNVGSCGGGGGGGFGAIGIDGNLCGSNPAFKGQGGTIVSSSHFGFSDSAFRGGFGGGAGGEDAGEFGLGGGGGGAIRIVAGGNVLIDANITADGGKGGDTALLGTGGGGGAGSGGAIWIQSLGNITIAGNLSANGGVNSHQIKADGFGGNGGRGFVRLEDADGIITVTGTVPGYTQKISLSTPPLSSGALKSDIACGSIGDEDNNIFFQIVAGFGMAIFMGFSFKTLFRSRQRLLRKTVSQNSARTLS